MCSYNSHIQRHSSHHYGHRVTKCRKHLLKPKMIGIVLLILCWNHRNSIAVAVYHPSSDTPTNNGISFHHHHQQQQRPYQFLNPHHYHRNNVRLRNPPLFNQLPQLSLDTSSSRVPFREEEINTFSEETALAGPVNPLLLRPPPQAISLEYSSPIARPTELEMSGPKRKKDCGEPSRATRGLLGPTLKRSYFAFTQDEVDQKVKDDDYRQAADRKKRDIQYQQLNKRSGSGAAGTGASGAGGTTEVQESPLPWTCETKYEWTDMGSDHYPRFVRTAECKNRSCFNGFFRCRARRYKTKILKRVTSSETSCEEDDVSLPETLRTNWKFITVTINLCCDCTGRLPGNTEV